MSNATRWYATRESVKAAPGLMGTVIDALIDDYIEAGSEDVEGLLGRRFIPETAIKYFPWPQSAGNSLVVMLDDLDLLAVTALQSEAQNTTPTTIASTDYFIEPINTGPPYERIEIDRSSSSSFSGGDTPQRSIAVTGRWGYQEATKAAGALAEADDGTETALDVTDSSLIGVGDTILIGTEAMFVSAKNLLTTGTTLNDASVTASSADRSLTVASGAAIKTGEVITLDSERCLVEDVAGNDVLVQRAFDGSTLAAHTTGITIYARRTLTIVRGVNGTTAAAHDTAAAITKYAPPADVAEYVRAYAIAHHQQGKSGWTGQIAGGEGGVETRMFNLWAMRTALVEKYGTVTL